jgi:fatty acid desaturase
MSNDRQRLRERARRQAEYDWEVRRAHQEIVNVERRRAAGRLVYGIFAVIGPLVLWSTILSLVAREPYNNWILTLFWILNILTTIGLFELRHVMTRRFTAWIARRSDEQRTETEADHG